MEAFHYGSMEALDVPCTDIGAKMPLRESGEDDSHLFVLEPNRDGHKEHHAGKYFHLQRGRQPVVSC